MAQTSLGVHPALRRRLQLCCGAPIAFFLIAIVVILVFRDNLFGPGKPGIVFGVLSAFPMGFGFFFGRADVRLWRRLRSFDSSSELTWIEVLEDTSRDERGIARRLLEFGDTAEGDRSRQRRWTLDERRQGSPVYLEDQPARVWALRASDDSGLVSAFSTSGYPFGRSARELRVLGGEPERPGRPSPQAAGSRPAAPTPMPERRAVSWRPDLPARFDVFPKMRTLQKSALGALLVFTGLFGFMAWKLGTSHEFFGFPIVLIVLLFGGAIYWARVEGSTIGPLTLSDLGLTVHSMIRTHDLDWRDVERVTIHGWNEKARRRQSMRLAAAGLVGGAVGLVVAGLESPGAARDRRDVNDLPPVDQLLVLAGAHERDVVPEIVFFDADGQRLLRLRGTHTWRAAHAVLSEAWARGKQLG